MRVNQTRERLANGETVFGCGLQCYRSPEIARTLAAAGFDYVFIDMEHSSFDLETVHDMITAALGAGITPIVRVAELLYSLIARLLDSGAQGIILPRIEEPKLLVEEAARGEVRTALAGEPVPGAGRGVDLPVAGGVDGGPAGRELCVRVPARAGEHGQCEPSGALGLARQRGG